MLGNKTPPPPYTFVPVMLAQAVGFSPITIMKRKKHKIAL
jgi:hypothetical protein